MTEKTLSVAVQYTRQASAVAHVRPYQNRGPLASEVGLALVVEALPEPGHHRVELHGRLASKNQEGVLCFEASCIVEGIVTVQGLEGQELDTALRHIAAPSVMGTVRSVLTGLSAGTGYGPIVLPPLSVEAVANLQPPAGYALPSAQPPSSEA